MKKAVFLLIFPLETSGWLVTIIQTKLSFFNFKIDSFTPGKILSSSNELGDVGKPFLTIALLITPSRSKNTAFFIHQFIFLKQIPILFHLILISDVKQLNAKPQLERLRYVE